MAAILIIVAGFLATISYRVALPGKADEAYFEFGSNIVNVLSIMWIMVVLVRHEKSSNAVFGTALRKEISTILLMIVVAGIYSMLKLAKSF